MARLFLVCRESEKNPASLRLQDGDSVTVIKDFKVKGSSSVVKVGTKVKGIRLIESDDGHNIGCKIEGFGGDEFEIGVYQEILTLSPFGSAQAFESATIAAKGNERRR